MSPTAQVHWLAGVTERVNTQLERLLAHHCAAARTVSPHAEALIDAVAELTLRGGKRLRPATAYAALRAVGGGEQQGGEWLHLAAALELLQTYFLIQDDWMDGDEQRRGGPAVHAAFARTHGDRQLGAGLGILASDLASGLAWEQLAKAPFPDTRLREAWAAFGRMHSDVIYGQQLDLLQHPDLALVHRLKTGAYTVTGPLHLGALLGDAQPEQLDALARFGAPLGLAFQLRDDLLGAFGESSAVGKPVRVDLRRGKITSLIIEVRARLEGPQRERFEAVFGNTAASDDAEAFVHDAIAKSGARARLEARLVELVDEALAALAHAPLHPEGVTLLGQLARRLIERDR